jgi:hypothetical protein
LWSVLEEFVFMLVIVFGRFQRALWGGVEIVCVLAAFGASFGVSGNRSGPFWPHADSIATAVTLAATMIVRTMPRDGERYGRDRLAASCCLGKAFMWCPR